MKHSKELTKKQEIIEHNNGVIKTILVYLLLVFGIGGILIFISLFYF